MTTIELTKKEWKRLIMKMLEKDEVVIGVDNNPLKIKLVKVDSESHQPQS